MKLAGIGFVVVALSGLWGCGGDQDHDSVAKGKPEHPSVPSVHSSVRLDANEIVAIATLGHLASVQAQFQAGAVVDVDEDGVGEYGYFGELSGATGRRGPEGTRINAIDPPLLGEAFRQVHDGTVIRSGYHFRIFLPDADGKGITEAASGGADSARPPDAQNAESGWCAYAWPVEAGVSGNRVFFVSPSGVILESDNKGARQRYQGTTSTPAAAAAILPGDTLSILGPPAAGAVGGDGGMWRPVNR